MLPDKIKFEIITPDHKVYSNEVTAVRVPGLNGYFGVLPGHTPFLAALRIGEIKVQKDNETHFFATSGGFVEVFPHRVAILAETAEPATAVDTKRAQEAKNRAIKRLTEGRKTWDVRRARSALLRAMNRIHVASK
ncbi:MAG: F0F1 ATP synthase subunit epsilon [bacterium]